MDGEDRTKGWAFVVAGVMSIGLAVILYYVFRKYEAGGGSMRLPGIVVMLYQILGKWGVAGFFGLFGIIAIWLGRDEIRKQSEE